MRIDDELFLFSGIAGRRYWAKSNLRLKQKKDGYLVQDNFEHEQCLVIAQEGMHILLSGCAHNGILNILDRYRELCKDVPDVVVSGFHMVQKEYEEEDIVNIQNVANELTQLKTVFFTGHCTGNAAYEIMKPIMGEQLREMHSGESLCYAWR